MKIMKSFTKKTKNVELFNIFYYTYIKGDYMNIENVGDFLRNKRESLGLTQDEVGKKLNLGRDAIIRIEKGNRKISFGELEQLSKLYRFDIMDLINGVYEDLNCNVKGIILAGGSGTRLYPITEATSKQLTAIYDKPMVYYPMYVLMQAGIRDILIITTPEDQAGFKRLLGDGSKYGINLTYEIQPSPDGLAQAFTIGEKFIGDNPSAMVLGDNMFYGSGMEYELKEAVRNANNGYATIFGYKVRDPERFGIMELDKDNNVLSVEEKPSEPKSDYAITGLYFYPKGVSAMVKDLKPSARGELEITSLNDKYLKQEKLKARLLGEGYSWFDTGTFESMLDASNMIRTLSVNTQSVICCPEAVAFNKKWLTREKLQERATLLRKNTYGQYLLKLLDEEE